MTIARVLMRTMELIKKNPDVYYEGSNHETVFNWLIRACKYDAVTTLEENTYIFQDGSKIMISRDINNNPSLSTGITNEVAQVVEDKE